MKTRNENENTNSTEPKAGDGCSVAPCSALRITISENDDEPTTFATVHSVQQAEGVLRLVEKYGLGGLAESQSIKLMRDGEIRIDVSSI